MIVIGQAQCILTRQRGCKEDEIGDWLEVNE